VQSQRRQCSTSVVEPELTRTSAAEIRAAAAERRLAGLAAVKDEPKSEESEVEEDYESEEDGDVLDPHLHPNERKREMEEEMDEEEKEGLRGGWEDFIDGGRGLVQPSRPDSGAGPSKRERSPASEEVSAPRQKVKPPSRLNFGAGPVRDERMRGLGLKTTGLLRHEKRIAELVRQDTGHENEENDVESGRGERDIQTHDDGRPGWRCRLCTFVNLADHGVCGESGVFKRTVR